MCCRWLASRSVEVRVDCGYEGGEGLLAGDGRCKLFRGVDGGKGLPRRWLGYGVLHLW